MFMKHYYAPNRCGPGGGGGGGGGQGGCERRIEVLLKIQGGGGGGQGGRDTELKFL